MENFAIQLDDKQLNELLNADTDMQSFLFSMFGHDTSHYQTLAYELQREFRQGGSPDVTQLAFDRVAFDAANREGRFRIVLDIRFTFGCEDSVTEKKHQTSEWAFTVDPSSKLIKFFSSPFAESRSTADEF